MNFKDYIRERNSDSGTIQEQIATLLYLSENVDIIDSMNESDLQEGVKDWLSKVGLSAHKSPGIIDYVKQFSQGAGKLILAAIKGDKEKVKEIAKSIKKEDLLDFLLKLDVVTMHLVTGPIHMIDAITGWHIGPAIKHAASTAKDTLKDLWNALLTVKSKVQTVLQGSHQKTILQSLSNIEQSIPKA